MHRMKEEMDSLNRNARRTSLEQEIKYANEKIDTLVAEKAALLAKLKSANVDTKCLKKEKKILEARSKQFQSGMKQNIECKRAPEKIDRKEENNAARDVFEVHEILNHKFTKRQRKFLVRWKGYDSRHDTWEPETSLNCPKILKSYLKSKSIK